MFGIKYKTYYFRRKVGRQSRQMMRQLSTCRVDGSRGVRFPLWPKWLKDSPCQGLAWQVEWGWGWE